MALCEGSLWAQAFPMFNGSSNTCSGAFLDSGGEGATGYGNNENITYTICPDSPNDAISLNFITFNLSTAGAAPLDQMTIHDGNSTAATSLGTYTGTTLQNITVQASPLNSSGCLTIVFRSNNTGTGIFAASISCYTPCQRPTAVATMSQAAPVKICIGESVNFDGSGSIAAAGFAIATRTWDFGDGTVLSNAAANVSHTYTQAGEFITQLYVVDNNGCASANRIDLPVRVGTEPNFNGTGGDLVGCVGQTLCLDGVVNATTWNELPGNDLGGGVFLPDDVGSCFESEITFSQFAPGQTLTNVNDLLGICVGMEHSFMGDLVINIISPTGQTVTLHQQGGGGTFLGIPVDNDLTPNAQGTCWNYCWSPTATNGTWVDNAGGTLPSGTYESLDPLSGLVGSQLNGVWRLQVCDLWGSDNGFICNWDVSLNPAIFPDLTEFTPIYGDGCDSTYWSGPHITSTAAGCDAICVAPPTPGSYSYTYTAKDDFGCTFDTTLTVTIVPLPTVNAGADVVTCGTAVPLNAQITSGGQPGDCTYTLQLIDTFEDGWTLGSNVTVTINGVATTYTLGIIPGDQTTITLPVSHGQPISLSYQAAIFWNNENRFVLRNTAGTVLYNSGNGPATGLAWSGVVACPPEPFTYTWSPAGGLSNPNIANPSATVTNTTEYCVTAIQPSQPACPATDCVTITVDNGVDPGTNGSITICANAAPFALFPLLGGTPDPGGTWTTPGGAVHSGNFDPSADTPGSYTYTVVGSPACGGSTEIATVTVVVSPLADAGTDGAITLCSTDAVVSLFAQLGGTPDANGTWSGPSPTGGGLFDPATMSAGVYTYTVPGMAPCPDASATVTVALTTPPDAGTDGAITLCSTDAAVSLFAQLGGTPDANGTWSGPSPTAGGLFDPATMSAGVYTYTVPGTAPCPDASATVTVALNIPPDAGTDGAITLCSTDAAVSLFAQLGGTPDANGTWSGPSPTAGGLFDPATMSAGVYTYTVPGTAPCPDASATVTVALNTPPDAGTDGAITLCSTDAAVSLFAQLGGTPDANGTWSGPSPTAGGLFDPATMSAGVYTYTVPGTAPCPDASATVTVTLNTPPDAGTDGAITLCSTDAAVSLFAQLGGTPDANGTWSGPSPTAGGLFDPATMSAGVYTYTVPGTAPCPDASATVTVALNTPPDAGTDGAITLCSTDAAVSLFAQLGGTPDANGTWSGPSPTAGGLFDPATMSAGVYTYTVPGTAPCPDASATVTVALNTPPDAGTDGAITLCSTDAAVSLFAQLGGTPDANGTWSGPSPTAGGLFDPATMSAGVYTYTVPGTAPCPDASATVTVALNTPPDAGTDGAITLCSTDAAVSLFAQLGGTPDANGTWSGPSPTAGGLFDPATMSAGVYTYTVPGTAPCPDASATVTVALNIPPDAGTDGAITLCSTDAAVSLFAQLGGTPDANGTWSGPSPTAGGLFDPATMSAGVYTYTVPGTAPCPDASATVTVALNIPPDAGTDGAITLCSTDAAVSLFAQLGGTPDANGTWSGPSPTAGGLFDPATMSAGVYTYTVPGTAPCPDASATVTVALNTPPDAGTDGAITLCSMDAAVSLFAQLGGTPDANGTWSGPSPTAGGLFDPATMSAGVYTYIVPGTAPCPDASATVTVALTTPPDAGTDGAITLCISSPATPLFDVLGGTPDLGGIWSGPGPLINGLFDPATSTVGTYSYTVSGIAPCASASATVDVNVVSEPDPGTPNSITLCGTDSPISLFGQLGGTPDVGGTWSGPSAVSGGQFDPLTMSAGVYTYTIDVPPPCVSVSTTITVALILPPDAGSNGTLTLCNSSPSTPLLPAIGGAPDANGTWSGPSNVFAGTFDPATMIPGTYTYTVQGTAPCPADIAEVLVSVVTEPDAGSPGAMLLCTTDASMVLYDHLGGTPDPGGVWSGPSAVIDGLFDPASMLPGVYTYTIDVPPPCVNASSTVTITLAQPPNAGSDGTLTLCNSSPSTPLLPAIGGAPDANGTWSGPSNVIAGAFDPATMIPGTYTYTVQGTAPCPADIAEVLVSVVTEPDAGSPGTMLLCTTDASMVLYDHLGGTPDPGGVWSGPSAVIDGLFDPASMLPGVYMYTIDVPPPCVNASSTVTITLAQPPNAGSDGSLAHCITSAPTALLNSLLGTPDLGGVWSGPSPVVGGLFDPTNMLPGIYTYTVAGATPCPAASAQVEVNVMSEPDPGGPGFITICSTDDAVDLFTWIEGTPDVGGTWSGPSAVIGGMFAPTTDVSGVYTYTLEVPPPCTSASTTVTVDVIHPPNAGLDGATTLCITSGDTPLFPILQGDPATGGTWTGPDGATFSGTFTPGIDASGNYTYSVAGTAPCPADLALVNVQVVTDPDPGSDGTLTLCASDASVDLFGSLGGTPDVGGIWTGPGNIPFSGTFDPAMHNAGMYTYTIQAPPPCQPVSSTVTVLIVAPPDAGGDGVMNLCATGSAVDLYTVLQGSPEAGGTWTNAAGSGVSNTFDPATDPAGTFWYTVDGTKPCPQDVAMVTINLTSAPFPGNDTLLNLCISGDPVDLFSTLVNADIGGQWAGPQGAHDGLFIPGTHSPGAYVYLVIGTAPCPSASATVTVVQLTDPDAGEDGGTILCSSNAPVDLFSLLQGTPDAGGIWLNSMNVPIGAQYDPATQPSDTVLYILAVPPPCVNDTSRVIVVVVPASDAGEPAIAASCGNGAPIDLFATLNGAPHGGGTWSGPGGSMNGIFHPGSDATGTYTYSVEATTPCPDVWSTVTVSVEAPPNAGLDGSASLCPDAPAIDLFSQLGGTPDPNGTWSGPGNTTSTGTFDPATDAPGTYTYTVWGTLCPDDAATASITIHVVPVPDAGPDAISCNLAHNLAASGTWASGSWSLPSGVSTGDATSPNTTVTAAAGGSYTFVWNTVSAEGCTSSDAVTVVFTQLMEGTVAITDAVCHGHCDGTATVTSAGGNGAYSYTWPSGIASSTGIATGLCAGSYTVMVADTNACSVSIPFTIGQPAPLAIDAVVTQPETCPGSCDGTIEVIDPEGYSYTINNDTQSASLFNGLCAGTYVVTMTNANGCIARSTALIASPPPVVPSFTYSPDTIFTSNTEVRFLNLSSSNAVSFTWAFGDDGVSLSEHPTHTFPGGLGGTYDVCLTATDANGCSNTVCSPLFIHDLLAVFVPNSFTPNGDGLNDEFLPIFNLPQVKDYQFLVFNRWGERIFGTDQPGKPWNGSYGGVASQVDVYVWKLTCKDALSGDLIERIGHVTIVQ